MISGIFSVPSPDGAFIYYTKTDSTRIFRAEKTGLNEEVVYESESSGLSFIPLLVFPGGKDLLAVGVRADSPNGHYYRINLTSHEAVDLGEGETSENPFDIAWGEPGKSVLFSRTVSGLTNIWNYSLKDRSLTQVTFGTGPDSWPMPDPGGKGIYFVNGKSSGFLTAYHFQSKESTDIVSENATQPIISPDGKRVMYITILAPQRTELWVSDIDGGNKVKLATGEGLGTGTWAPDNFHLSYEDSGIGAGAKAYIVGADGNGLRQLPRTADSIADVVQTPDQNTAYVTGTEKGSPMPIVWRVNLDGSNSERFVDNCCLSSDIDPAGQYLLGVVPSGEKTGVYEISIADRKCVSLLPGTVTYNAVFARDGKSFLYAVASRGEVAIYRQPWKDGKTIGAPQIARKVPFAFQLAYAGSSSDFTRDLSTIVYARPGGHADIYLLSQK